MSKGWIKLHRSLLDWEWYDDINARILLIHLLVSVNYEDKKWKGVQVKKGSMVLSWSTLSNNCGLSIQKCRTAMRKLIESQEVTRYSTNKFQVISLVKWEKLQGLENELTSNLTINQQSTNNQLTTTKETNNIINKETNYSEAEFLNDWNELRTTHLKKPSHLNSIGGFDAKKNFKMLLKSYNREEFKKAMIGLFRQKKLPNGNTTMQSNPRHFLSHFEPYHAAFYDKNESLYGKVKETV